MQTHEHLHDHTASSAVLRTGSDHHQEEEKKNPLNTKGRELVENRRQTIQMPTGRDGKLIWRPFDDGVELFVI